MGYNDHQVQVEDILIDFKDDLEEWQSEIEGTPTPFDMHKLGKIYQLYVTKLDGVYGYNKKAATAPPNPKQGDK